MEKMPSASQRDAQFMLSLIIVSSLILIGACKNGIQDIDADSRTHADGTPIEVNTGDKLVPSSTSTDEYLFVPPFEDTKIMGHQIKWIHRFPVINGIDGFTDIAGSLYFLAAGNSVIEKTGEKWTLKTRLNDDMLNDIWGSDKNNIYVTGRNNLFHFDGKQWKAIEDWKNNNFGYEKVAKSVIGCPNGNVLVASAIVLPTIPYHRHEIEISLYDFFKDEKWETFPSYDEYPDGASNTEIMGLDCSGDEIKIYLYFNDYIWDGNELVPAKISEWIDKQRFIVFQFDRMNGIDTFWSDQKGFLIAAFNSEKNDSPVRFYKNGKWTEIVKLGNSIKNHYFTLWGLNKNDIDASGDINTYHYNGSAWTVDKVHHLQEMEMNYVAGVRSDKFSFMGGNDKEGVYGIINTSPQIIFKRSNDGNWWPVYQEYGPYGEEWAWQWMWPSGDTKFMIANTTSLREFDIKDIPDRKLQLRKVMDLQNEKILDAYSADPHRNYLLVLDKDQETDVTGHLLEGQKTGKHIYLFDGENIAEKVKIDDKRDIYTKIIAFKESPDGFLLYGSDAIALYDGKKWTEKKVCGKQPSAVLNIWGNSTDDFYIAGDSGCLMRKKQEKWIKMGSGTDKHLTAITGNKEGELFIARSDGTLFKYKDNKAEKIEVPLEEGRYIIKIIKKDEVLYSLYNSLELAVCEEGTCEKVHLFINETRTAYYVEGFGLLILEEETGSIIGILDKPE